MGRDIHYQYYKTKEEAVEVFHSEDTSNMEDYFKGRNNYEIHGGVYDMDDIVDRINDLADLLRIDVDSQKCKAIAAYAKFLTEMCDSSAKNYLLIVGD